MTIGTALLIVGLGGLLLLKGLEEVMNYLLWREYRRSYPLGYSFTKWRDLHAKDRV